MVVNAHSSDRNDPVAWKRAVFQNDKTRLFSFSPDRLQHVLRLPLAAVPGLVFAVSPPRHNRFLFRCYHRVLNPETHHRDSGEISCRLTADYRVAKCICGFYFVLTIVPLFPPCRLSCARYLIAPCSLISCPGRLAKSTAEQPYHIFPPSALTCQGQPS